MEQKLRELTWQERGRLWLRLGIRVSILVLLALGLRYLVPPLLSLLMPFVLALLLSWLLNPLVKWLQKRLKLPRGLLSLLLILLCFAAAGGVLAALGHSLFTEVSSLSANWEGVWASLQSTAEAITQWLDGLLSHLPVEAEQMVNDNLDKLNLWLGEWAQTALPALGDRAKSFAFSIPSFLVSLIVFIMATYFITADYPHIRFLVTDRVPRGLRDFLGHIKHTALGAFGGYVRAEVIISIGVFLILLVGFLFLGQGYAVLLALLLAVLDFIPIIGSGTLMVPWAVVDLIMGDWGHALGLMIIWGIVCVFRRVAEPKAVGSQTGLSPVLSLVSMYVGMKLAGVLGMILGPIVCLVILNICRTGIFGGLAADLSAAAADLAAILRGRPPVER